MNDRFIDRCAAGGLGLWRFRIFTLVLVAGLAWVPSLLALDEFGYDLRLARKLCEIEMFDYAARQVDGMQARYPKRRDEISLEQARVLFLNGKAAQAEALLGGITAASAAYNDSRLLLADIAISRGNYAQAKTSYREYLAKNSAPASTDDDDVEAFKKAVSNYAAILTQEGDGAGAAKVMDYLAKIAGDAGSNDRQLHFLKPQRILAAADQQLDAGKTPVPAEIQAAVAAMEALTWDQVDEITAAALVEAAHGYLLLGQPDKAIRSLRMGSEIMGQVEEEYKKQNNLDASPLAGAQYYYGVAQAAQAATLLAAGNRADAEKQLTQALKRFQKVRLQYSGSPYATRATLQLGGVKQRLERDFGRKIDLGGEDADVALRMEKADALYRVGKKMEAIPLYQEAAVTARGSSRFPAVALRLVECYVEAGKYWEAQAVADYAAEAYAADPAAAEPLLRLGAAFYKKATDPATAKAAAATFRADAITCWDHYVDLAPTNPKSPELAFLVAETLYGDAAAAAAKTKDMPEGKDKEAAKADARALYVAALPKYERLVAKYPSHEKGVRALYKMGWIYLSTQNAAKAAEAFHQYAEVEANPKYSDDVLEARFRAGEQLMTDSPAAAIGRFKEVLERFEPGKSRGLDLTTPGAKRVQEDATVFLGWAYDLAGEAYRPELDTLNLRLLAARRDIKAANAAREKAAETIRAAEAEKIKARAEEAEIDKSLRGDAAGKLEKTVGQSAKTDAGANQLEQSLAREKAADLKKQLSSGLLKNTRDNLTGEKLDFENLRAVTRVAADAVGQRLRDAQARDQAMREKLKSLATQRQRLETDVQRATAEERAARKSLETALAEQETVQKTLAAAKAAQKAARTAADRRKADENRGKVARELLAADRAAREAKAVVTRISTPEGTQRRGGWEKSLASVAEEMTQRQISLLEAERAVKLGDAERLFLERRLDWLALALKRNTLSSSLLEKGGLEALAGSAERRTAVDAELAALREATDRRVALADLRIVMAKDETAAAAVRIQTAEAVIRDNEAAQGPILAKMAGFKQQARAQFERYLAQYPQGRQAPEAMARIGTILLDDRQFDAAAAILNDLAGKYPNSKAVGRANYNLGRARMETNQPEEAAKVFGRVLAQAATQPVGNLDYIADKMLAAGHPGLALIADQELIRRGNDPKHPDSARLRAIRETILFRAGAAALQSRRPADAVAYLETLLREKSATAYFFEAKLLLASARCANTPPDPLGATRDLAEVVQYSTDPVLTNRALVAMGGALAQVPSRDNFLQAAARYQQVVLLADPAVAANRPLLEQAVAESAKLFGRLGDPVNRDRMVKQYQETWPAGRYIGEMGKLPAADFPPPPAATK
jgi:TolA-binding protein